MPETYLNTFADLFYPQRCVACLRRASDVLCRSCFDDLPRVTPPVCGRCGMQTAFQVYGCDACRNSDFAFDSARAPLKYEGVGEELVHALKYRGFLPVVDRVMAPLMARLVGDGGFDVVMCVPLHRKRLRKRGFNQAELMSRALAGSIEVPFSDRLRAVRGTRDQVELSAQQRKENVAGAFDTRGDVGGSVVLVDDVFTTGATLNECAGVLKAAGAREVHALTICRTM